jgi:hypothetical protein
MEEVTEEGGRRREAEGRFRTEDGREVAED